MIKKRYTEEQTARIFGELRKGKSIVATRRQYRVREQAIHRRRNDKDQDENQVKEPFLTL